MNLKKLMIITLFGALIILSAWGGFILGRDSNGKEITKVDFSKDSTFIDIHVTNTQRMPSGTAYTLVLKNTSKYLIKQNSVYLSYPIKQGESGIMMISSKLKQQVIK
ncbi:hypothetical protein JK636_19435 [Clostridium sp. YIM B02515]|uniref:Uncharacterized protein n=1 Tax=Clostridium rhizosphaerae TaxID=2803861 RepID=A0ABS1TF18_9CLOT|nr:hypothetical protein [Clostridium rhizosphaerae]MBL4937885.1 hypothetical protein [Clostridium rhizosphaerae]